MLVAFGAKINASSVQVTDTGSCAVCRMSCTIQALSMDEDDTADYVADSMDEENHVHACPAPQNPDFHIGTETLPQITSRLLAGGSCALEHLCQGRRR